MDVIFPGPVKEVPVAKQREGAEVFMVMVVLRCRESRVGEAGVVVVDVWDPCVLMNLRVEVRRPPHVAKVGAHDGVVVVVELRRRPPRLPVVSRLHDGVPSAKSAPEARAD